MLPTRLLLGTLTLALALGPLVTAGLGQTGSVHCRVTPLLFATPVHDQWGRVYYKNDWGQTIELLNSEDEVIKTYLLEPLSGEPGYDISLYYKGNEGGSSQGTTPNLNSFLGSQGCPPVQAPQGQAVGAAGAHAVASLPAAGAAAQTIALC